MPTQVQSVSRQRLGQDLRALGVTQGMNLMVHSSLRRIGPVDGGAQAVLEALREIIGPQGTLLAPTVTGQVQPDQPVFHAALTPSNVGHLTNVLRQLPGAVRSLHPVHSVAAVGPQAEFFTAKHLEANTPWSPETAYGRMVRDKNCSLLFLGVDLNYNSCFHALEIEARLPGMHTAQSTTLYVVEGGGRAHQIEHHWHDSRTQRFFADMEGMLHDSGCLRWDVTGRGLSRLVQAVPMRQVILRLLSAEPWLMTRPPVDNTFVWEP